MKKRKIDNLTHPHGLKGQHNLAQGFALGWGMGIRIVRAITFLEGLSLFRTKRHVPLFRPEEVFCPDHGNCADGFGCISFPQAVPGARINWPFRPEEIQLSTCV